MLKLELYPGLTRSTVEVEVVGILDTEYEGEYNFALADGGVFFADVVSLHGKAWDRHIDDDLKPLLEANWIERVKEWKAQL